MNFESWHYTVSAEVTFTKQEYEALIELAKRHYDSACRDAGLRSGETDKFGTANKNGFLAQLAMFPTTETTSTVIWPFRSFDIVLKILEMWPYSPDLRQHAETYRRLDSGIHVLLRQMSSEHARLKGV